MKILTILFIFILIFSAIFIGGCEGIEGCDCQGCNCGGKEDSGANATSSATSAAQPSRPANPS